MKEVSNWATQILILNRAYMKTVFDRRYRKEVRQTEKKKTV